MKSLKYLVLAAVLAGAGCDDESAPGKADGAVTNPDAGGTTTPDGGASPDGGGVSPDGGGVTPDGGAAARTLVEFVKDLVNNKTDEKGTPESIDDKTLSDTSDPAAFDSLF
jgi:hypothetical protein